MVASLYIDKDETLWVSATGEGVYSYRFDTGKLTHYAHNPSIPNTLSNNNVNNIMQDSNGNLWFSTSGSGLTVTARRATTSKTSTCRKTDYPATVSTKYSNRPYKRETCC